MISPLRASQWDFLTAPHEIAPGRFAWWTLPPGVRSFEAEEYTGIDQSFKVMHVPIPLHTCAPRLQLSLSSRVEQALNVSQLT